MKARPILFNGAMVRALLDGSKTQTRRAVKSKFEIDYLPLDLDGPIWPHHSTYSDAFEDQPMLCPYGQPGDRLWVRETHAPQSDCWGAWERSMQYGCRQDSPIIHYAADKRDKPFIEKWRPSIHMPRWASRILLEVASVRVEQLQDISEVDAKAEGIKPDEVRQIALFGASADERADMYRRAAVRPYRHIWESINGAGSWEENPWVWVIEFKKVTS